MKLLIALIFTALSNVAHAQFGLSGAWQSFRADAWYEVAGSQNGGNVPSASGYVASLDYWFRLKNYRVEFLPELSYGKHSRMVELNELEHRALSFYFNVNVYPFDIKSDCDCPTWSKDGNFFTKGFYLQFSPGISHFKNSLENSVKFEDETHAFAIGGGAGVDIGLSDFLTVTPFVRYHFYPNVTWEGLPNHLAELTDVESDVKILSGGIRVGFRPKKSR